MTERGVKFGLGVASQNDAQAPKHGVWTGLPSLDSTSLASEDEGRP